MAYDEGLAQCLRDDLAGEPGIAEKRMFGGLCLMLNGNMLCGVHGKDGGGGMFRVGREREAAALAVAGAAPMRFTGRPMAGMIEVSSSAMADDTARGRLLALALAHARSLPAK